MWDLAYLIVNLEMEETPRLLLELYATSEDEGDRVHAYIPLAMAHCATWAAVRGGVWTQHQHDLLRRVRTSISQSRKSLGRDTCADL